MKILKLVAGYALGRAAINQARRMRHPRRRAPGPAVFIALGAGIATYFIAREVWLRREQAPQWPSRKKIARDARRREAQMRAQQEAQRPPPEVHVEREATTELKTTLGDVAGDGLRR